MKKSPYWIEKIFDRAAGGVKMTHVDALLLSLASANILVVQRVDSVDRWNIARTNNPYNADVGSPIYTDVEAWKGVNLHCENRVRKRNAELLLKVATTNKSTESDAGSNESDSSESSDDE